VLIVVRQCYAGWSPSEHVDVVLHNPSVTRTNRISVFITEHLSRGFHNIDSHTAYLPVANETSLILRGEQFLKLLNSGGNYV
jgi:hypothetical protein